MVKLCVENEQRDVNYIVRMMTRLAGLVDLEEESLEWELPVTMGRLMGMESPEAGIVGSPQLWLEHYMPQVRTEDKHIAFHVHKWMESLRRCGSLSGTYKLLMIRDAIQLARDTLRIIVGRPPDDPMTAWIEEVTPGGVSR